MALLIDDVQLSMPPLPAWFDGIESVRGFLARMFETPWRLDVTSANGQSALVCWQSAAGEPGYRLGGLTVLTIHDGRIGALTCFLAPLAQDLFVPTDDFGRPRDS